MHFLFQNSSNGLKSFSAAARLSVRMATLLLCFLCIGQTLHAATITVTSDQDSGANTLRQAVIDALSGDQIDFSGVTNIQLLTPILIDKNLVITGPVTIDGAGTTSLLNVQTNRTVTLSALSFENGFSAFSNIGGAVTNLGTLTVTSCQFNQNSANTGGAILNRLTGSLVVSGSTFDANTAVFGGAIGANGGPAVSITTSTFTENSSQALGGAIYVGSNTSLTLLTSELTENSSLAGGAVYSSGLSFVTISDSTFDTNSTTGSGGAVYSSASGVKTITNAIFNNNSSSESSGGAILTINGPLTVENSTFTTNSAAISGGALSSLGGDITISSCSLTGNSAQSFGGAMNVETTSTCTVMSTLFSQNEAVSGGALYTTGSGTVLVSDSTIAYNSASGQGGGVSSNGVAINFINVTVSGNTSSDRGGGVSIENETLTLYNSLIAGNEATVSGTDIYSVLAVVSNGYNFFGEAPNGAEPTDKTFANTNTTLAEIVETTGTGEPLLTDNGGPTLTIALLPGSVLINSGNNSDTTSLYDQRGPGYPRIIDAIVDIGAYEFKMKSVQDLLCDLIQYIGEQDICTPVKKVLIANLKRIKVALKITPVDCSKVCGYLTIFKECVFAQADKSIPIDIAIELLERAEFISETLDCQLVPCDSSSGCKKHGSSYTCSPTT